jgi:drug/metabolite transporter (DMT)-like permease
MPSTYGLVVLSAVMHAYWNFLLKQRKGTTAFVGLSKVAEVVVFAPVFLLAMTNGGPRPAVSWAAAALLVLVGAALTLANYAALARAYHHGDLSFVYPVTRGSSLLFLPPLGFLVFGERLDGVGWVALGLILLGLVTIQLRDLRRRAGSAPVRVPAIAWALIAGLAAAGYTIWDKRAIAVLPAFAYFYAYSVLVAAAYGAFLSRRYPWAVLAAEWRANRWAIVQVGVFNTLAYLLVLVALRTGTSSYVIALRQISIVFGVLLGVWLLGESLSTEKRIGVALLVLGCALVALAR